MVPKPAAADAERAMSLSVAHMALSFQKRLKEGEECVGRYGGRGRWKGGRGEGALLFFCICARNPSKQKEVKDL